MLKNILICGEDLESGGVETAIVNDAIALKKKGNNVYILAKKGVYTKKVESVGIENIEFEFEFINGFDFNGAKKVVNIIKEKEIEEVHIHKFIDIPICVPACIIAGVPYVAHIHEGLPTSYDWIMNSYDMYKSMLEIYLKNAYRIIAITENVKKYNMQLFNIPEEKYLVIHNSINFELFDNKTVTVTPIKKFLLISRLSKEKEKSIQNGIDLFTEYSKHVDDCKMRIAGRGNVEKELKEYVDKRGYTNIEFIGQTENIPEEIANADIVLGMGRCMIEAMASKRLCCIIGYEKIKSILQNDILKLAEFENFSGRGLPDKTEKEIVQEILNLTDNDIDKILEDNYNFAREEFDIEKNAYSIEENINIEYNVEEQLFEMLDLCQQKITEERKKSEEIWKGKLWLEEHYNNAIKELETLKQLNKENNKEHNSNFIRKIAQKIKIRKGVK